MTRRILVAMIAVTVLAIGAFSVPAALAIRSAQQRGELLELQREASIVANRIPATGPIDESVLQPVSSSEHRLGLYAPNGALLGGVGPEIADQIVRVAIAGNFAEGYVGNDLVAAVPVRTEPNGASLVMRIEAPRSASRGRFLRSLAVLAAAGLGVLVISGFVGMWLARRLNRPIDELRRWASAARPGRDVLPPEPTGIAELDALRDELLADRHHIDELVRRERSFSSHVSHQLRTPVAAMRVAVETELAAPRPDPATVLEESIEQLDRLESTITSLLALARDVDRPTTETDLTDLVAERVTGWRGAVTARHRSIAVLGESLVLSIDADAVGHIVDVVLDNSIRHGSGAITVEVVACDESVLVDVSDEGHAPHERDPFADRGSDSGHGIGLRLARSLAEACGGELELLPLPTTTFRLRLPRGDAGRAA